MPALQGASANSSGRSSLTNLVLHDADAAAVSSDAESSRPAGPAPHLGPAEREAMGPDEAAVVTPSDQAESSKPQPAGPQGRGEAQRAVGFPIVPVKVGISAPLGASSCEAPSGPSFQPPAPAGGTRGDGDMHDILGSEALAAALRDANGSPGRAGITPYPLPGAHLAHIAAQGRGQVYPQHSCRHTAVAICPRAAGCQCKMLAADLWLATETPAQSWASSQRVARNTSAQGATGQQQHESTVGMVMAVPHPPPPFLLAGQTTYPRHVPCGRVHGLLPAKHTAAGGDVKDASDLSSTPSSTELPPAPSPALVAHVDDDAEGAESLMQSVQSGKAATERGGPVYLEQPDGSVQLKLLRNPLYRPPVDAEDGTEEHDVPLYQAVLDETCQARITPGTCC